jgi:hypothetical protein
MQATDTDLKALRNFSIKPPIPLKNPENPPPESLNWLLGYTAWSIIISVAVSPDDLIC